MRAPTLAERIVQSFAAWERRGRGWQLADYLVSLEPPFRPFFLLPQADAARGQIDDGRYPTLLSSLADRVKTAFGSKTDAPVTDESFEEPAPGEAFSGTTLVTRRILIPHEFPADVDTARELLRAFANGFCPVAFELVGTAGTVTIQITCSDFDAERVFASIDDYAPDVAVLTAGDLVADHFDQDDLTLVVDWGLSEEFFLPLATVSSFQLDPFIPLITALARARAREAVCFQVLIEPLRNPWRNAILHAIAPGGDVLFDDAPEFVSGAKRKTASPLFACVVRTVASAASAERRLDLVRGCSTFTAQFAREGGNALIPLSNDDYPDRWHGSAFLFRKSFRTGMILSLDELVGLVHMPDASVRNDALVRSEKRTKALPAVATGRGVVLGENVHRGVRTLARLGDTERLAHTMIVGASGTGKSTLLVSLIVDDMERGAGLAVLDPHGDLIDEILSHVPTHRLGDVILFDPSDQEAPVGFNVLEAAGEFEKSILASDVVGVFQRLSTSWGDTMSTVLSNAVLAMLEHPSGGTLLDLRRFLVEDVFRAAFLKQIPDPEVRFFWEKEWPLIGSRSIGPILTRLNTFLRSKLVRDVVGQSTPKLRLGNVMQERRIFLGKLSQGLIGNENAYLLGSLLLSGFLQQAFARQRIPKAERTPFWLYLDEAEHFVTPSVASLLTEARKYGVGMHCAFQMLAQLKNTPAVGSALLGNTETRIVFRVGDDDARKLADSFASFEPDDLRSLARGEAIVRIGPATNDFTIRTQPLPVITDEVASTRRQKVCVSSREKYATPVGELPRERNSSPASVTSEISAPSVPNNQPDIKHTESPTSAVPPARHPMPRTSARTANAEAIADLGKGGQAHKYLQHLIKRLGEERGFRASIEEPVPGGQVDVALYRADCSIACEVSITTSVDHELANVRKCLAASFTQLWLIVPDDKRRKALAKAVTEFQDTTPIRCLGTEELVEVFDAITPPRVIEQTVAGYTVRVSRKDALIADAEQRRTVIADVLARSISKQRK